MLRMISTVCDLTTRLSEAVTADDIDRIEALTEQRGEFLLELTELRRDDGDGDAGESRNAQTIRSALADLQEQTSAVQELLRDKCAVLVTTMDAVYQRRFYGTTAY